MKDDITYQDIMITEESHQIEIPPEIQKANPSRVKAIVDYKTKQPRKKRVTFAEKNLSISPVSTHTVASP